MVSSGTTPRSTSAATVSTSRHRVDQQPLQPLAVLHAKIAERVIVDSHAAQDPAISDVGLAPPVQFAGAADPVQRGRQPQGDQNLRRDRRASGRMVGDFDVAVKGLQVERFHERPHEPRPMVGRQHLVERQKLHFHLRSVRPVHAGRPGSIFSIHAAVLAPGRPRSKAGPINSRPLREKRLSAATRFFRSRLAYAIILHPEKIAG